MSSTGNRSKPPSYNNAVKGNNKKEIRSLLKTTIDCNGNPDCVINNQQKVITVYKAQNTELKKYIEEIQKQHQKNINLLMNTITILLFSSQHNKELIDITIANLETIASNPEMMSQNASNEVNQYLRLILQLRELPSSQKNDLLKQLRNDGLMSPNRNGIVNKKTLQTVSAMLNALAKQ